MKFVVNGNDEFTSARELSEYIADCLDSNIYDEMLEECYGKIEICGLSYSPAVALYRVDEVAYNCGMMDYYNSLAQDMEYELDNMDDGETINLYGFSVVAVENE
jgi:hypothetical protein